MKSIFNTTDNKDIINRINKLSSDSTAQWGKMKVSQMLAHAQVPIKVSLGEVKLKRGLIGLLFGSLAKKQLLKETPFKKDLPTDKNFIIQGIPDFEKEKQSLITLVQRLEKSENNLSKEPHPFFGKMEVKEWDALMMKHLDHHLQQFGV